VLHSHPGCRVNSQSFPALVYILKPRAPVPPRGGPENLRWFWSMTVNGPMTRSNCVATLEEAKARFQKSWDEWEGLGEA
jgi:hypothetical protein